MAISYSSAPLGSKQRSSDLIQSAKKVLDQTKAEGSKAFKGSKYDTPNEPIDAEAISNVKPINLPEPPIQKDVGNLAFGNMAGLTNPSAGIMQDANGLLTVAPQTGGDGTLDIMKSWLQTQEAPPNTADIYSREQRRLGINDKRQEVQNYTNQLNSIVSKAKADTLAVTGQGRGIPEVIIGGQQAQINKEAAIAALPVQAQLAAAQGNLEMAEQQLNTIFNLKVQDAKAQYDYKNKIIDTVMGFATKAEERRLQEKKEANNRQFEQEENNLSLMNDWSMRAIENGQSSLVTAINNLDPKSPTFQQDLGKQIAKIQKALTGSSVSTGGVGTGEYTPKQLQTLTKLNQDVSKNSTYSKTTSMRNYGDNVIASLSLGSGVGDIAAINQFQKVIDEGAVTRDQDVKLIQGAQSLANTLKTKLKRLEKGEQLSPELRTQMRTAVESMYEKQVEALQKDPYIKAKTKEAELYGLTVQDTILGELGAFTKTPEVKKTKSGQDFDYEAAKQAGYSEEEIRNYLENN